MLYFQDGPLTVRPLEQEDCEAFPRCFAAQGWEKPRALFRRYLEEQGRGERRGVVALWDGEQAGYLTLLPKPRRALLPERAGPKSAISMCWKRTSAGAWAAGCCRWRKSLLGRPAIRFV